MYGRWAIAAALVLSAGVSAEGNAYGQNPNYPGYIGVYVVVGNGGMRITGFIRDTPAAYLAEGGQLDRNDTIVRLAGRSTRTLTELRNARNNLDPDKFSKMIVRKANGDFYYLWVTVSPAVAMARNPNDPGSANLSESAGPAGADRIIPGGRGTGGDQDFRPKTDEDDDSLFGNPPPGGSVGNPAPR